MIQHEQLDNILARYQEYPLFENCTVADANSVAVDGDSILHKAVMMKDIQGIKVLLNNAADPNHAGNTGDTPLHEAAFNNNLEIVEILISCGAVSDVQNQYGETPADLAKVHKSNVLLDFLRQH